MGVYKLVGQMRMIFIDYYVRKLQKKPVNANFDAQYAVRDGRTNLPDNEDITIIRPFTFRKYGKAYFVKFTLA